MKISVSFVKYLMDKDLIVPVPGVSLTDKYLGNLEYLFLAEAGIEKDPKGAVELLNVVINECVFNNNVISDELFNKIKQYIVSITNPPLSVEDRLTRLENSLEFLDKKVLPIIEQYLKDHKK